MVNFCQKLKNKFLEHGIGKYRSVNISVSNYVVENGNYVDNGFFIYNNILLPMLDSTEKIYFRQYSPQWSNLVPKNSLPKWQRYLDESVELYDVKRKIYTLKKEAAISCNLKDFWFDSSVCWDNCEPELDKIYDPRTRKYYQVAEIIFQINKDRFPFFAFLKLSEAGVHWKSCFIDNPFVTLKRSTRSWVLGNIHEDSFLCPYRGMGGFTFFSELNSLMFLIEQSEIFSGEKILSDKIFMLEKNESVDERLARLIKRYF